MMEGGEKKGESRKRRNAGRKGEGRLQKNMKKKWAQT